MHAHCMCVFGLSMNFMSSWLYDMGFFSSSGGIGGWVGGKGKMGDRVGWVGFLGVFLSERWIIGAVGEEIKEGKEGGGINGKGNRCMIGIGERFRDIEQCALHMGVLLINVYLNE